MKAKFLSLLILAAMPFLSCQKDNDTTVNKQPAPTPAVYYIEGKVDGVMYRAEYVCEYNGCDMVAGNYNDFIERITMQRMMSKTDQTGWDIHIRDVDLDALPVPSTIYATNMSGQPSLDLSFYTGEWSSDNNYLADPVVLGENSFELNLTSKIGDVMEGTFSGQLRNGSDTELTKTVTDGKFKIKLIRI